MTAIRNQKFKLRHQIVELVTAYIDAHPLERSAIEYGLLTRLLAKMTLPEMKDWIKDLTSSISS